MKSEESTTQPEAGHTWDKIRRALWGTHPPKPHELEEYKLAIADHMRKRFASPKDGPLDPAD